ncbi:MAG: DUF4421 family protein [Flavobacteriales bacterium]
MPYIDKFNTKLNMRLGLVNAGNNIEIESEDDVEYKLSPNESLKLSLTANYDFLSLSFSYTPNFIPGNNDNEVKGNTNTRNFGLNLFLNRVFGRLDLNRTEGYYLTNTKEIFPEHPDKYIIYDNLIRKQVRLELGYNTNKNYSYRASTIFNEKQNISAGSFIPRVIFSHLKHTRNEDNLIRERVNNYWAVTGNYNHTFVMKKHFFITTGLGLGTGLAKVSEIDSDDIIAEKNYTNLLIAAQFIFHFGYNSDRYFFGVSSHSNTSAEIIKEVENSIQDQTIIGQFYFGYRFGAPKILKKSFDGIKGIFRKKK